MPGLPPVHARTAWQEMARDDFLTLPIFNVADGVKISAASGRGD
jgi:hypothetical protein